MKSRPRVGIVTTHPIQYYAPLFRRLSERGVVHPHVFYGWEGLVSGGRDPGFQREIAWDVPLLEGYEHTFVPNESARPGSDHRRGIVSSRLVPSITEARIDALLVVGWNYQSHLAAMRAFHGRIPVLFRGDSTLVDETRGPSQWLRRAALRWVYRHVDVGLYTGANNRKYFEVHGLTENRLAWVPHTVDNQRFADPTGALEREARAWRGTLGIPDDATTVLFAGKLEAKKAPDLLLHAFENRDPSRLHLILAGSGPLEAKLREKAAGRANVHFIGFQNQSRMPVVYRLGDVFALPSRGPGETWGLAVNEAMACARSAIVSDRVGCAPDLVQSGRTGFVFRSGSLPALISALDAATKDGVASRMGRESERLISGWSMDVAAESIESTVERVIR